MLLLTFVSLPTVSARTYTILFGGTHGFTYFPSTQNILVGDTIQWVGDFSTYNLQSTFVPTGAINFGPINTGDTFIYVVKVLGEYDFQNNKYASVGMTGNFIAKKQLFGLTNEGKEFYLGLLYPSYNTIVNSYLITDFNVCALISTHYENDVSVSYFNSSGKELDPQSYHLSAETSVKILLDVLAMQMDTASDAASYKSCHIRSKYPITVFYISVGTCSGGSYLALPVLGLGKNYVAASYNDNPGNGAIYYGSVYAPKTFEYAGGEFIVIASEDQTDIKITPSTTTVTGHAGANTGTPHPFSIQLNKGQSYLARSNGRNEDNDMSGSIIEASKPITVISGHENASLGGTDPYGIEARDFMIEEMVPVEYWDTTGYISIPLAESLPPGSEGQGDSYRIYSFDTANVKIHLDVEGINGGYDFTTKRLVSPPEKSEITLPVEAYSTNGKKISLMQYDQRSQPVKNPWPAPSMMTIVPYSRWKTSYSFAAFLDVDREKANNSIYINLIGSNLSNIKVSHNGSIPTSLSSLSRVQSFSNLSSHLSNINANQYSILSGFTFDTYHLTSSDPFMIYYYGFRDFSPNNTLGNSNYANFFDEYAAPAGMQLNTGVPPSFIVDTTSTCTGWHICIRDTGKNDPGLKAVILIDDPDGVYWQTPGAKYSNTSLDATSTDYADGELHPHVHGPDSYCFDVNFTSALSAASAPLAIVDNLGNAIILRLDRTAPAIQLTTAPPTNSRADSIVFPVKKIGEQICTTFVFKNTAPKNGTALNLSSVLLTNNDTSYKVVSVTPSLPHALAAQDSLMVQVCYTPQDSSRHRDSLIMRSDCFSIAISLDAHGSTGLISASDLDFGSVTAGDTLCKNLQVKNVGSAPFTLTKSFVLSDNINFTVDSSKLPIIIQPNGSMQISICFHPIAEGSYSGGVDWSTDLEASFAHSVKSHSVLSGSGTPKASVKELGADGFSIRPNPAHDRIVVSLGTGGLRVRPTELMMFDVLGREVYHQDILSGMSQIEIPVRGLSEGVYFVQVGSVTQRVVVTH